MASNWKEVFGFPSGEIKRAKLILIPLDPSTGTPIAQMGAFALPYYPQGLNLTMGSIGWQEKQIPGMAQSIFQYTGNSSPTLSFTLNLSCDIDPAYYEPADSGGLDPFNMDLNAVMAWLRALTMPQAVVDNLAPGASRAVRLAGGNTRARIEAPPVIQVVPEAVVPDGASGIGAARVGGFANGGTQRTPLKDRGLFLAQVAYQDFYGVVDNLSFDIKSLFNSGFPRLVDVQMSMRQTIQIGTTILPQYRADVLELAQTFGFDGKQRPR